MILWPMRSEGIPQRDGVGGAGPHWRADPHRDQAPMVAYGAYGRLWPSVAACGQTYGIIIGEAMMGA